MTADARSLERDHAQMVVMVEMVELVPRRG
jgi:hypothetical protein